MNKTCGIYQIICMPVNKIYIGSSNNIDKRIKEHFNNLRKSKHPNIYFQRLWNKYGEKSFTYSIIEECSEEVRFELEEKYLLKISNKINLSDTVVVNKGKPLKEETKEKIRKKLKGVSNREKTENIKRVGSLYGAINGKVVSRKVIAIIDDTETIFESVSECERVTGITRTTIRNIINNKGNSGNRTKYRFNYA